MAIKQTALYESFWTQTLSGMGEDVFELHFVEFPSYNRGADRFTERYIGTIGYSIDRVIFY